LVLGGRQIAQGNLAFSQKKNRNKKAIVLTNDGTQNQLPQPHALTFPAAPGGTVTLEEGMEVGVV